MSGSAEPSWTQVWEDDVTPGEHVCLGELLGHCFPHAFAPFEPGRSWVSARPELRLVARLDGRVVAHLAVLRRFVQVDDRAQLVGDVGLVATHPDVQGHGIGADLLVGAAAVLRDLEMPFGLLTCGEQVAGFYERGGWVRVRNPLRMVRADGRVQDYRGVTMVLPVLAPMAEWPEGRIDRNGLEV